MNHKLQAYLDQFKKPPSTDPLVRNCNCQVCLLSRSARVIKTKVTEEEFMVLEELFMLWEVAETDLQMMKIKQEEFKKTDIFKES